MNILFWNTNMSKGENIKASNIDNCLLNLVMENRVDLLILAEYGESIAHLCKYISNLSGVQYIPIPSIGGCKVKGIINGLFALPFVEEVVGKRPRRVDDKVFRRFYNPTWKFFGNRSIPYTTYHYFDSGDMSNCY